MEREIHANQGARERVFGLAFRCGFLSARHACACVMLLLSLDAGPVCVICVHGGRCSPKAGRSQFYALVCIVQVNAGVFDDGRQRRRRRADRYASVRCVCYDAYNVIAFHIVRDCVYGYTKLDVM